MASGTSTTDLYPATRRAPAKKRPATGKLIRVQPKSADDLVNILKDSGHYPSPLRPVGSGSSVTRGSQTSSGTLVDMTRLDKILAVKGDTVVVQAGVRLRDLAEHLAADNMELVGGCQDPDRTVGGAVSSASLGARLPGDGSQLASTVCQITLINGEGRLLGIIYSVTLRIRPIQCYSISTSRVDFPEFANLLPTLMDAEAAVRATLFPFKDSVHVELRYPSNGEQQAMMLPRKLRDWATHAVLPKLVRSVNKAISVKQIRGSVIDTVTEATHSLNRFAEAGSNAAEQTGRFKRLVLDEQPESCVWFFPVAQFARAVLAYQRFCELHFKKTGFRCDLPADAWRMNHDQQVLLSPSFTGPVFALNLQSTSQDGWDDFLMEFAELAARYQGIPVFNLTTGNKPGYANHVYGEQLRRFREMRQKLDRHNRFFNQYFAEQGL
jgi:FAD/FMN-containing dehydrogenase